MNKDYWTNIYKQNKITHYEHSSFAKFITNRYSDINRIVDLGCGNGRDSCFFASKGVYTIAIDQSTHSINNNPMYSSVDRTMQVIQDDFVNYDYSKIETDLFYSRFTLHSITAGDEDVLLQSMKNTLPAGGKVAIEARSTQDPLYGVGLHIRDTTYQTDHMRRFIDAQSFIQKVIDLDYKIMYFDERDNLSVVGDDNPVLMRIILCV